MRKQRHRWSAWLLPVITLPVITLMVGCGQGVHTDYSSLNLIDVEGVVTLDGAPLPEAVVQFETPEGTYSYGQTDESGHYQLMLNTEKSGVIPGPKVVRVRTGPVSEDEEMEEETGAKSKPAKDIVPACYNKKTKLKVHVDGSKTTFNFDLLSDCSTTGAN